MAGGDALVDIISAILTIITFICYARVVTSQFRYLKEGTKRLQVLACRTALCIPIYAFIIFISLLAPAAYEGLQIPITLFEGYSFYCFFALLVNNLGGPDATLR